jgi:hypothetical protein
MSGARGGALHGGERPRRAGNRWQAMLVAIVVAATSFVVGGTTTPAAADTTPADPSLETVSAAVLPTVQIDGVVWDQVIVGNRVYATGDFTRARPAGAAPGTNETVRSYILAYDLVTGELITSWAPSLNAQGLEIKASADGATIYVGGDFDRVNGEARTRVAALDAQTGELRPWNPAPNGRVDGIAVNGDTVYLGGDFTRLGSVPRLRLAAVDANTGALRAWAPEADLVVNTMVVVPSGNVIVGGTFNTLNGTQQFGMGALDGTTGEVRPWPVNTIIRNHDGNSAINALTTDGTKVYGVGWTYLANGGTGNFEGVFAANAATGALDWVIGGRGDNYDLAVAANVLYTVGHPHDWGMVDFIPQTNPWTWQRAMAIDTRRSPTLTNAWGTPANWQHFRGRPAADPLHWLPTLTSGTFTGQGQAAWSVATNGTYTVLGGEFPRVNGTNQQGLVRFAKRSVPQTPDAIQGFTELKPVVTPLAPGTVRIGWTAAWDRDNARLLVEVLRGPTAATSTVIRAFETNGTKWWDRPPLGFVDTTAPPGSTQTYRVRVTDALGTSLTSSSTSATIPDGSPTPSTYGATVLADNPAWQWRMGETDGTTAYDRAGSNDLTLRAANSRDVEGALVNDTDGATNFPGTSNTGPVQGVSSFWQSGPQTFSLEAWLKTSTNLGGKILGFGNSNTGRSNTNQNDRNLYMSDAGQIFFGVRPDMGTRQTINSSGRYNDGQWHHVVATLSADGMKLYVDGGLVASNASVTKAQVYRGYWRVGGDQLSNWPTRPTREAISAQLDEIAVYPHALSADRVGAHYAASGRGGPPPPRTDTSTTLVSNRNPAPVGANVTFTATVSPAGAAGTVQFSVDGTPSGGPVTLNNGTATFSRSNLSAGTHQIRAAYSGSALHNESAATITQTIETSPPPRTDTTTTLASDRNPATVGANVTFTATVSPAGATGTVQFSVDGTPSGGPVTLNNGTATFSRSDLAAGNHQIRAAYSGSGAFNPSAVTITQTMTTAPPPPPNARSGYWMVGSDGAVFAFGDVANLGRIAAGDTVDIEPTPSGNGYWIVTRGGAVSNFGDAPAFGDARGQLRAGEQVVSMSTAPANDGYWLFTDLGRVFAFGAAPHFGDLGALRLNGPVLGSIATPTGRGYYMVASDGGVFAFGDAAFYGSMGGTRLNAPVMGLVPDRDNVGYWLVASDGGIFAFDAPFWGSMGGQRLNRPVIGMVGFGGGYLMVAADGGIFNFSDKPFFGSLGGSPHSAPIVAVAAFASP